MCPLCVPEVLTVLFDPAARQGETGIYVPICVQCIWRGIVMGGRNAGSPLWSRNTHCILWRRRRSIR